MGESEGMSVPNRRPTSTWNGFPLETHGSRVMVVTNLESIALANPFLMSRSSIGERQSVGGAISLTCLNAPCNARTCSPFNRLGEALSEISAISQICCARAEGTRLKFFCRKEESLRCSLSLSILCSVPISTPCGCGRISFTGAGNFSVTAGQDTCSMTTSFSSSMRNEIAACGFTIEVMRRY